MHRVATSVNELVQPEHEVSIKETAGGGREEQLANQKKPTSLHVVVHMFTPENKRKKSGRGGRGVRSILPSDSDSV